MRISNKILAMAIIAMMLISVSLFVNAGAGYQADLWWFLAEEEHTILGRTYKASPEQAKVIADYLVNNGCKDFSDEQTKSAKALVEDAIKMINATGAANLSEVPAQVKTQAISKVQQAAAKVDVKLNVDTSTGAYAAVADGKALYSGSVSASTIENIKGDKLPQVGGGETGSIVENVLEGKDQTYNVSDNNELRFRFDTDYSYFKDGGKVYIDGKELASSDYTSKSGSTIISVKSAYAKKLDVGKHTIEVAYTNGTRSRANFTVVNLLGSAPAPTSAPVAQSATTGSAFVYTGSNNVVAVLLSSIAVVAVSIAFVKKVYVK